jgi:uncharacterized protein (TIGR02453 family)
MHDMEHVLPFLKKLKKNNNKVWFDANRSSYEAVKKEAEQLVRDLVDQFGRTEAAIAQLTPKDCMFRINRDVRFSKDKSPYKTNFGIALTSGGKKSPLAGYYLHLEPGASFVGGGLWMPPPPVLAAVRQEIDYQLADLQSILRTASFRKMYGDVYKGDDVSLSRVPKGYEADNPAAEYLRLKSFLAMHPLDDGVVGSSTLAKTAVKAFVALKPLVDFLNRAQEN